MGFSLDLSAPLTNLSVTLTLWQMTQAASWSNECVTAFNASDAATPQTTVVVSGPARSGTTMMAQVLIELGVPMGENLDIHLYEDVAIRRAFLSGDQATLESIIAERNETSAIWGWKYPGSLEWLDHLEVMLRHPYFIFTFRDPIATSIRNFIADGAELLPNMGDALNYMKRAVRFAQETSHPVLFASYEKCLANPDLLIEALTRFLRLPLNTAKSTRAISRISLDNAAYKKANAGSRFQGWLDTYDGRLVTGWAWERGSDRPVTLELWIDGQPRLQFEAASFRPDLKEAGVGSGHHAFKIDLNAIPIPSRPRAIDVRITETGEPLFGSPIDASGSS